MVERGSATIIYSYGYSSPRDLGSVDADAGGPHRLAADIQAATWSAGTNLLAYLATDGFIAHIGIPSKCGGFHYEELSCQRCARSTTGSSAGAAVRIVRETNKPIAQIAKDLGLNPETLGKRQTG